MDAQDIRTLKILEEIDQEQSPSQRDLATKLNISLGLVNSFIKRLAKKGYFKVTQIPANRVRYILTPKGAAEKTRLTYEYIQYSIHFYKVARRSLVETFRHLKDQKQNRVVFWGISELAEIAYLSLQEAELTLVGVIDGALAGEWFLGRTVHAPADLDQWVYDKIIVTAIGETADPTRQIISSGGAEEEIVRLSYQ